jgi:hypothetical protein
LGRRACVVLASIAVHATLYGALDTSMEITNPGP